MINIKSDQNCPIVLPVRRGHVEIGLAGTVGSNAAQERGDVDDFPPRVVLGPDDGQEGLGDPARAHHVGGEDADELGGVDAAGRVDGVVASSHACWEDFDINTRTVLF